LKVTAAVQK